jgi:hypothetical protein
MLETECFTERVRAGQAGLLRILFEFKVQGSNNHRDTRLSGRLPTLVCGNARLDGGLDRSPGGFTKDRFVTSQV